MCCLAASPPDDATALLLLVQRQAEWPECKSRARRWPPVVTGIIRRMGERRTIVSELTEFQQCQRTGAGRAELRLC